MTEPELSTPAEARAWAMAVALEEGGFISSAEWDRALASGHALAALERLATEKRLADAVTLARAREDWRRAAERTPHGLPVELPDLAAGAAREGS